MTPFEFELVMGVVLLGFIALCLLSALALCWVARKEDERIRGGAVRALGERERVFDQCAPGSWTCADDHEAHALFEGRLAR